MEKKNGILTVGELKEMLAKLSDDTEIVVAHDGWYRDIAEVILPDEEVYFAVTLFTKDTFVESLLRE